MTTNSFNIQASGGDFATIALWEDDRDTNGVISTDEEIGVLNAAENFAGATIVGWTDRTGAGLIRLTVAEEFQHNGNVNSSVAGGQAVINSASVSMLEPAGELIGLFQDSASTFDNLGTGSVGPFIIDDCISTNYISCSADAIIKNCILFHPKSTNRGFTTSDAGTSSLLNCTVIGAAYIGIMVLSQSVDWWKEVRNCVSLDSAGPSDIQLDHASNDTDYVVYGTKAAGTTVGANSVGGVTATDLESPGAGTWAGFLNLTGGSEDYRLIEMDQTNELLDAGIDRSASGVTEDIVGVPRSDPPDIGAFELVTVSGASANPVASLLGL